MDYKNGKIWDVDDIRHYEGLLSYYKMVEPDCFDQLVKHYEEKYHVSLKKIIKYSLNNGW